MAPSFDHTKRRIVFGSKLLHRLTRQCLIKIRDRSERHWWRNTLQPHKSFEAKQPCRRVARSCLVEDQSGFSCFNFPLNEQRHAEVPLQVGPFGFEFHGAAVSIKCSGIVARLRERFSQVELQGGRIGHKLGRLPIDNQCFVIPVEKLQCRSEIDPGVNKIWCKSDGGPIGGDRSGELT